MRSLTRVPFRRTLQLPRLSLSRPFTAAPQLRLKEDTKQDPEEIERQKQQSIKGSKEKNPDLESKSEEVVGADREHVKDDKKHMEDLQKQTAQKSEENHPEGKS